MIKALYEKACEKIPGIVADLAKWNGIGDPHKYALIVRKYHAVGSARGSLIQTTSYSIDEDAFISHIRKAKQLPDATITVTDTVITVERKSPTGDIIIIAEYRPITE